MKSSLFFEVYERLMETESVMPFASSLIEAAFGGSSKLDNALKDSDDLEESSIVAEEKPILPKAYLQKLEVAGFRGIGPAETLYLDASPGLTIVTGRNGSGKSSFAEALEVLLTGETNRWSGKKKSMVWKTGWRNLHKGGQPRISASFLIEGQKNSLEISRVWKGDVFEDSEVKQTGAPSPNLETWSDSLKTFRPFLSYNELGRTLSEGPSVLYEQLRGVLGMEELSLALTSLGDAKKELNKIKAKEKKDLVTLRNIVEGSADPRGMKAKELLGKKPDRQALEDLVIGELKDDSQIEKYRSLASLNVPTLERIVSASNALAVAVLAKEKAEQEFLEGEGRSLAILKMALDLPPLDNEECPVCGTHDVLSADWRAQAEAAIAEQSSAIKNRDDANKGLKAAQEDGMKLIRSVGRLPSSSDFPGFQSASEAKEVWDEAPKGPQELARHLESAFDAIEKSYASLRNEAQEALKSLDEKWRPIRRCIEVYLEAARMVDVVKPKIKAITEAEKWLTDTDNVLRQNRFEPIRKKAQEIWEVLRHQSNVSIEDIKLAGTKSRRHVDLKVTVDGHDADAIGVMSQGELHAMLLSLFLPRLTLDESPFRFVMIDDPVQAMDPAKVDGLSRVLEEAAKTRQVIVFTHDSRLTAAIRRMQIPATVLEVNRGEQSVVKLRPVSSRSRQFLSDARLIIKERHAYGPYVPQQVVPGLCRSALEAHLQILTWKGLLKEGNSHEEIQQKITNVKSTVHLAALAFYGAANRSGDVFKYLNNKGRKNGDTLRALKEGAHQFKGDAEELVRDTTSLLKDIGSIL